MGILMLLGMIWSSIPQPVVDSRLVVNPKSFKREGLISGLSRVFEGVMDGEGEGGGGMSGGNPGWAAVLYLAGRRI